MQQWEYKTILRRRGWNPPRPGDKWHWAADWNVPIGVEELLKLGEEGWELVTVCPRSSVLAGFNNTLNDDAAGFTSDELWVFKRPKP